MNTILLVVMLASLIAVAFGCLVGYARRKSTEICNMANTANQPGAGTVTGFRTFYAKTLAEWTTFTAAYTNAVQPPGRYALVALDTTVNQVVISTGATDKIIGIAQDAPAADLDPINVRLLNSGGTALVVAAAAISLGDYVQSNGDGAVKTAVTTGYVIGRALQAAGAAGDVIEVALIWDPAALI